MAVNAGNKQDKNKMGLINRLAIDVAHNLTWQAFLEMGYDVFNRPEMLQRFRNISNQYPENKHHERVKKTIALLTKMVKRTKNTPSKLPPAQGRN